MRTRVFAAVAALVLATAGTLVLLSWVRGAEQRARAGERTEGVLVVRERVVKGTRAEDLAAAVAPEQIPARIVADGAVTDLASLAGRVTAVDLVPGEQVVEGRFVALEELADAGATDVPEGLQEVTVALQPQRALGGRLEAGDRVGVFLSFAPDVLPYRTHLTLQKVLVTRVQGGLAPPEDGAPAAEAAAPSGDLLVTFAVDPADAERLVFTAEYGTIWLSAQPESAREDGTAVREPETIYP